MIHFIYINRAPITIQQHHNRKPNRSFCSSNGHDEEYEHLAVEISQVPRERHKGQVDGIQHQLHTHEDDNGVFARKYTNRADGEEDGTDCEITVQIFHEYICNSHRLRMAELPKEIVPAQLRFLAFRFDFVHLSDYPDSECQPINYDLGAC